MQAAAQDTHKPCALRCSEVSIMYRTLTECVFGVLLSCAVMFTVGVNTFLPAKEGGVWQGIYPVTGLNLYGIGASSPRPQKDASTAFGSWAAILVGQTDKTYINSGSLDYQPEDAARLVGAAVTSGGQRLSTLTNPGLALPPMGMVLAEQQVPIYARS